jgi:hypothetical protein
MGSSRRWIAAIAVASALGARALGHFALHDVAHVMDEITYLFQAKLYASLHLSAPVALPRAAFNAWFVDDRTSRFGIFPPGWPAVLAVGVRLHLAAWVNPALHGITVALMGRAGEKLGGARLGVIAAALYGASPQALALAAGLMSHTLVACAAAALLVTWIAALRAEDHAEAHGAREGLGLALGAGAMLGLCAATRPLCATILGLATAGVLALVARRDPKRALRASIAIAAAAAPFLVALLAYNHALTGSALRFPQMMYFDEHLPPGNIGFFQYRKGCNELGFGAAHGCDYAARSARHSLLNALDHTKDNLQCWLLLVCGPTLIAGVGAALARAERRRRAALLLVVPGLAIALYSLYWHGGTCYGARFYHAALPALVLAIALGLETSRRRLFGAAVAATLAWNALAFTHVVREIDAPTWGYFGVDGRFAKLHREWTRGPALVMVVFGPDDVHNPELGWTSVVPAGSTWMLDIRAMAALAENATTVADGEIVFAKFHPALVDELVARYPGRALYLYVANADASKDTLAPYDPAPFTGGRPHPRPADNFEGFRTAPPLEPPIDVLRAADQDDSYP